MTAEHFKQIVSNDLRTQATSAPQDALPQLRALFKQHEDNPETVQWLSLCLAANGSYGAALKLSSNAFYEDPENDMLYKAYMSALMITYRAKKEYLIRAEHKRFHESPLPRNSKIGFFFENLLGPYEEPTPRAE